MQLRLRRIICLFLPHSYDDSQPYCGGLGEEEQRVGVHACVDPGQVAFSYGCIVEQMLQGKQQQEKTQENVVHYSQDLQQERRDWWLVVLKRKISSLRSYTGKAWLLSLLTFCKLRTRRHRPNGTHLTFVRLTIRKSLHKVWSAKFSNIASQQNKEDDGWPITESLKTVEKMLIARNSETISPSARQTGPQLNNFVCSCNITCHKLWNEDI